MKDTFNKTHVQTNGLQPCTHGDRKWCLLAGASWLASSLAWPVVDRRYRWLISSSLGPSLYLPSVPPALSPSSFLHPSFISQPLPAVQRGSTSVFRERERSRDRWVETMCTRESKSAPANEEERVLKVTMKQTLFYFYSLVILQQRVTFISYFYFQKLMICDSGGM